MVFKRDGVTVPGYTSEYVGEKIVIAIDSSKSNTAIAISGPDGHIYHDYEIDGSGSDVDVYDLSYATRRELRNLLEGADILHVGIEDIITKAADSKYKGMTIHQSRAKITHVFDSFIIFFMDIWGKPERVNNQAWKAATLPERYRRRDVHKGSKAYFDEDPSADKRWAGRKDDVTDVVCISKYLHMRHKFKTTYYVSESLRCDRPIEYCILPATSKPSMPPSGKEYQFNSDIGLEKMVQTVGAKIRDNEVGYFLVSVDDLSFKDIWDSNLSGVHPKGEESVLVVVAHK